MEIAEFIRIGFEVLLAAGVGYWLKVIENRQAKRENQRIMQEQERYAREQERLARMALMEEALTAILRDRIIQSCRHFITVGSIPPFERENIERMYRAYHGLGGNDIASDIYRRMTELALDV